MTVSHAAEERILGGERQSGGLWTHNGKLVVKAGPVELPDGSIGTNELAPGAAQEQVGSYAQLIGWTLPTSNVWTETPIQVVATVEANVRTRIEFNVLLGSPTKGQRIAWAIMVDGIAPSQGALGALDTPENNFGSMATGTYYVTPATTGSHRFAFGLYGPSGSQIFNAVASTLYVTEQKR